jgi:S-adenosylmethionine-diacylglycerol 3-amino-3-carboxypropyl transferase
MMHRERTAIEERTSFRELRYASCWEDATVLVEALEPLDGARCLSIASAGDNTLSLVARGVGDVWAVDVSPAQLALVELKMAAFGRLEHPELLGFLGVHPCRERAVIYESLRSTLSAGARAFWDTRTHLVRHGLVHAGRLERYFRIFRQCVLPLIHSRRTVAALLTARSPEERERFYAQVWNGWRWRLLFRVFFSRAVMGHLGRDPEFFREVHGAVATPILDRTRRGLTELPTEDNPYLHYVLTGHFGPTLPDYLRPERHEAIRRGLDRVRLVQAPVEEALLRVPLHSIDAFNLSNVAEYMPVRGYHRLLGAVRRAAAPGARVAYWNLLAPRHRPARMGSWLEERAVAARGLHAAARTFFYDALVLEVVR